MSLKAECPRGTPPKYFHDRKRFYGGVHCFESQLVKLDIKF